MPMLPMLKPFNNYKILFFAGTDPEFAHIEAYITCYQDTTLVATIRFYENGFTLPLNVVPTQAQGIISMSFHIRQFNNIITTLRYEKPLVIQFHPLYKFCRLGTGQFESVGEQEGFSSSGVKERH